mgnify:CR=1 FL=1
MEVIWDEIVTPRLGTGNQITFPEYTNAFIMEQFSGFR